MQTWDATKAFMERHQCSLETALYYQALRAEGCSYEQALLWCGLCDPRG